MIWERNTFRIQIRVSEILNNRIQLLSSMHFTLCLLIPLLLSLFSFRVVAFSVTLIRLIGKNRRNILKTRYDRMDLIVHTKREGAMAPTHTYTNNRQRINYIKIDHWNSWFVNQNSNHWTSSVLCCFSSSPFSTILSKTHHFTKL